MTTNPGVVIYGTPHTSYSHSLFTRIDLHTKTARLQLPEGGALELPVSCLTHVFTSYRDFLESDAFSMLGED